MPGGRKRTGLKALRNNVKTPEYERAIQALQDIGFVTELWVAKNAFTLRWAKRGSQWHVTVRITESVKVTLEDLGMHALNWCTARSSGGGRETNYAVKEV